MEAILAYEGGFNSLSVVAFTRKTLKLEFYKC
jgi:hypothetical protein